MMLSACVCLALALAVQDERQITRFSIGPTRVASLAFSPSGALLAAGGESGVLELRAMPSGEVRHQLTLAPSVEALAFSPDGRTLFAGCIHGITAFDTDTGKVAAAWDPGHGVRCLQVAADGDRILAGGMDRITLSSRSRAAVQSTVEVPGLLVMACAFGAEPDGIWFGHWTGFGLADLRTRTVTARFGSGTSLGEVHGVAFSPDGRLLASSSADQSVRLWELATRAERARCAAKVPGSSQVAFTADGARLLAGSWDQTVHVLDVATGREEEQLRGPAHKVDAVATAGALAAAGYRSGDVAVWRLPGRPAAPGSRPASRPVRSVR